MVKPPALAIHDGLPAFVRARGGVRLVVAPTGRGAAPLVVAESGGFRVRFPRVAGGGCEGVLINTGGGLTGGDAFDLDVRVRAGAAAVLTTQAAEKVYCSDGPPTTVALRLALEAGSALDWLPQEQILFDGARLARRLDVALAPDARLILVESTVFGRGASGESLTRGAFRDRWRVRREGRLVFAEEVRLDGAIDAILARPAIGGGARAVATVLHVAPDAESRRDAARGFLEGASSECGLSAFDGMLVARFLSPDPQALRADLARFLERLRGAKLPRSWQT